MLGYGHNPQAHLESDAQSPISSLWESPHFVLMELKAWKGTGPS